MYTEELFQDWLADRAEKFGKKINTERSVQMARNKLDEWGKIGYSCDAIITHAIEVGWRGLYLPTGMEPRQKHLRPQGELRDMAKAAYNKMPKGPSRAERQQEADNRRNIAREHLAKMRAELK